MRIAEIPCGRCWQANTSQAIKAPYRAGKTAPSSFVGPKTATVHALVDGCADLCAAKLNFAHALVDGGVKQHPLVRTDGDTRSSLCQYLR